MGTAFYRGTYHAVMSFVAFCGVLCALILLFRPVVATRIVVAAALCFTGLLGG
jgi:hypothetical protein